MNYSGRVVLCIVLLQAANARADQLPFPPAPATAGLAQDQFVFRATAVIEMNACDREDDYLTFRKEMAAGNFVDEGENLAHILLAKMAFFRTHRLFDDVERLPGSSDECIGNIFRPHPSHVVNGLTIGDDGSTLAQFAITEPKILAGESFIGCVHQTGVTQQAFSGHADGTVLAPEGINVHITVSASCMQTEVNEAIMAMQKTTNLGSSSLPCLTDPAHLLSGAGEYDVNNRELVRILYLSGPPTDRDGGILFPETIDYMYEHLLAARGGLSDDSYSIIIGCTNPAGDEVGTPEDTADRHAWYRDLARDLGDLFEWALITYLTYAVFPGGGALIAAPFLIAGASGELPKLVDWDLRIPESENHRLNIETSRYLTNAAIIKRLEMEDWPRVDEVRDDQAGVHDWLLQRLQDIAANDFQEYNARPYSRYSLNAVLNLFDFAAFNGDEKLATAAGIVLDLSAAKFAATSNRGRRIAGFRRLSDADGDDNRYLFETENDGDYEVGRAMLLSGQIQETDSQRSLTQQLGTLSEMANPATSQYRLPMPILSAAIERRHFEQTMRHAGVERVEQSAAFTISAGGVQTSPAGKAHLGVIPIAGQAKDLGIAMPTVIIPTIAGAYMRDLFRFAGDGVHFHRSENTCVGPGFACGIEPRNSQIFMACTDPDKAGRADLSFVSSAKCFPGVAGPHFYLALRTTKCSKSFCPKELSWGVIEIVEATPPPPGTPDVLYEHFKTERGNALMAIKPDKNGGATYTTQSGVRISFTLKDSPRAVINFLVTADVNGDLGPTVSGINDGPGPEWKTAGGVIDADGKGRATIKGPGGPITIDFSDWKNPQSSARKP